jgi:large-conductance mechanosensitive channel
MVEIVDEFIQFFTKTNIVFSIIVTVISTFVTEFALSFVNNLILPIIYRDSNNDGIDDIDKYAAKISKVRGIKFKTGLFYISLVRFLSILVVIFMFAYYMKGSNIIPGYSKK